MAKQLLFDQAAHFKLKKGVDAVADAVKGTLGPQGHNVLQEKINQPPLILNNGYTIIKQLELKDPFENLAVNLVKEAAKKTKELTGDGTTTMVILTQVIYNQGLKNIIAGTDPLLLKQGIDKAVKLVIDTLNNNARPVNSKDEITWIAAASAKDDEIGEMIADTLERVGENGVIKVEEGQSFNTVIRLAKGMHFQRGYISPYMADESNQAVLENPYILITDQTISSFHDIQSIVEKLAKINRPLFIIANNLEGEALKILVTNKIQGRFKSVVVKTPDFGEYRKEYLHDIAVLTGAMLISNDSGLKLKDLNLQKLGQAAEIRVTKEETVIIKGKGDPEAVIKRIEQIKYQINNTKSTYKKDKMKERLARLGGAIAIIEAGGVTETEIKKKKLQIENALSATKAAIEEGILSGGGISLIEVLRELENYQTTEIEDSITGINIVKKALCTPLQEIANNAGFDGQTIVETVKTLNSGIGFNASNGRIENMMSSGIIDPLKVIRIALQNAVGISTMLLTSGAIICDIPGFASNITLAPGQMLNK